MSVQSRFDKQQQNDPILFTKAITHIFVMIGVGRTGTFIAIDHAQYNLRQYGQTTLIDLITELRNDRVALVQTPPQYVFVHNACVRYAEICRKEYEFSNCAVFHPSVSWDVAQDL